MKKDLTEIQEALVGMIRNQIPPLKIRVDKPQQLEAAGTVPTMQGKQKVDGMYFASVIPKPKDIRLYFFPIYMYPEKFELSEPLKKCLKGKSCFHVRALDEDLEAEITAMIQKGVDLFRENELVK